MALTPEDLENIGILFDSKLDGVREEMRERFRTVDQNLDRISKEVETLSQEYYATRQGVSRTEKQLTDHEERIDTLEKKVA